MIKIREVASRAYSPGRYGLLKARRRLARVRFQTISRGGRKPYRTEHPDRALRPLLPEVYEKIAASHFTPPGMVTEKIRAEWDEDEQAFILHYLGMSGFEVMVTIQVTAEDAEDNAPVASEDDVEALHGSALPRIAG
jgi:hypothetical protein